MKRYTILEYVVFFLIIGVLVLIAAVSISSSKAAVRDAKRLSDVKQIQAALELYFNDHRSYPVAEAITLGEGVDCQNLPCLVLSTDDGFTNQTTGVAIMPVIPRNPKPGGTPYKYVSNGETYFMQFELETDINNLAQGFVCASPFQINNGPCQ